jgi:cobalt-zinc-cadmium efflux system outer membrane protein
MLAALPTNNAHRVSPLWLALTCAGSLFTAVESASADEGPAGAPRDARSSSAGPTLEPEPDEERRRGRRRGPALSLEQAVQRALARSPEAVLGERAVDAARATRVGAGLRVASNPRISGDLRPNLDPSLAGANPGFGAMTELRFDVFGAPGARIAEAERRVAAAGAELALTRLDARLQTTSAYIRAQLAEESLATAEELLAIAARVLAAVDERAAVGAASDVDATSAQLAVADARAERAGAEAARDDALRDLGALLDLDPGERPSLTTPITELPAPPTAAALARLATRRHPEVAVSDARAAVHEATRTRLARELAPQIGVYAGLDLAPASPMFGLLGLSVELPVFQRNQGPRAVAAAEREREETRAALTARRIARDVDWLRDAYAARRDAATTLDTDAVPTAARRLALIEEGWRLGRLDVFRVTTARDDLLRARTRRLNALADAWATWIALERAMGVTP